MEKNKSFNELWNNGKCWCGGKNIYVCKKDYVWNHTTCICEDGKHLAGIRDDSTIICNEVIKSYDEEIETLPTNFNEKKVTCKTQIFYILLGFLSSTIALLIAVSI